MTVTAPDTQIDASIPLADLDFNRRGNEDRQQRPIPPGRDFFAPRWRRSQEFLFGPWIDIDAELGPNDLTRARDDYFWQADEHMIGVVDMFERVGARTARPMFEQALTQGIATVDNPPQELVELFAHLDNVPDWFDREAAERGRLLVASATLTATAVTAGWAYFETAMTGDISAATGATGRFKNDGVRRNIETLRMFALMTTPEVMQRDSEAFQTVIRVRLMHALVSRGLKRKWGEETYRTYGEPIAASSLLGFGNGPVLIRLVDHQLGRTLSRRQLDDIAMYSAYTSWALGAPERLRCKNGLELVKSLNYIFARGGEPSKWRAEVVDTFADYQHEVMKLRLRNRPQFLQDRADTLSRATTAAFYFTPLAMVFGPSQVDDFVEGSVFESLGYNYKLFGLGYEAFARVASHGAALRDRVPGIDVLRKRLYREGPIGVKALIGQLEHVAKKYHNVSLDYTHHDESTSGKGFTG